MNSKNTAPVLFLFFFLSTVIANAGGFQDASAGIYAAIQSDDSSKINVQLAMLEKSTIREKDAYTGALMMKKSGMEKGGLEKLSIFKKGRNLLENSIKQDSLNAEYRFLRLLIQEHAPDFLNYHSKKQDDAVVIRKYYPKLSPELREAIRNYSRNSKILKPEDFQK